VSGAAAREPIFRREDGAYVPTGHARGPWDAGAQHGGAPAALLATALQQAAPGMRLARITYELLGPVPLAPLTVEAEIVRPGRRFQLLEGRLVTGGRPAVLARAVALGGGEVALPAGAAWEGAPPVGPEASVPRSFPGTAEGDEGFHQTGMAIRYASGSITEAGAAQAWFALHRPLVDDEPASPLALACAAADFGNGISRVLDFDTHLFVNTDLTVSLLREPEAGWVLLDAVTRLEPTGVGWASSTLYDRRGPIGFAQQTLFVAAR
jgi:hypothetical protein